MATIYCTHKLAKWISGSDQLPEEKPGNDSWNANLFKVERKNWLICVHNPTAYSILFPEVKKAGLKKFALFFYPRLTEQFLYEGIPLEMTTMYPSRLTIFLKSNNNKRTIGVLNNHVSNLKYCIPYWGGVKEVGLLEINHRLNKTPIGSRQFVWPIKEMENFLEEQPG